MMDLPNVDDVSNAGACVPKASVSILLMSATMLNLTGFEKEHFSPKNIMPERESSAYFLSIEDLKFHHCQIRVLTAIMANCGHFVRECPNIVCFNCRDLGQTSSSTLICFVMQKCLIVYASTKIPKPVE